MSSKSAIVPLTLLFGAISAVALWLIFYVVERSPFQFFNMMG